MGTECGQERLQDRFLVKASFSERAKAFKAACRSYKETSNLRTVAGNAGKRSSRVSHRPSNPRFLQQILCNTQEGAGEVAVYPGSQQLRTVLHSSRRLQDGNGGSSKGDDRYRGVGRKFGLPRCLLSCSHSRQVQEIPKVRSQRKGVSVPGSSHGPLYSCTDFHKVDQGDKSLCTETRGGGTSVHRRLVGSCTGSEHSSFAHEFCDEDSTSTGLHCKYSKVRADSDSGFCISGTQVQYPARDSVSVRGEIFEGSQAASALSQATQTAGSEMAVSDRQVGFFRESSKVGDVACQTNSSRTEESLVTGVRQPQGSDSGARVSYPSFEVVDSERQCPFRGGNETSERSQSGSGVHRLFYKRLGRNCRLEENWGILVPIRDGLSYQCAGVNGYQESAGGSFTQSAGQECVDSNRQYHSSQLCEQTGGNEVQADASGHVGLVQLGTGIQDRVEVSPHSRQVECDSRPVVEDGSGDTNGVVAPSSSVQGYLVGLGSSSDRPICDQIQQQVDGLLLADPGSSSGGGRRILRELEEPVRLRLSSDGHSGHGVEEGPGGELSSDSDSTMLAPTGVVSSAAKSHDRLASQSATKEVPFEAANVGLVSQRSGEAGTTRLAVISGAHVEKGFREEVAQRIAKAQKSSSISLYESKWRIFCDWCAGRSTDPLQATVPDIADFLCHLHDNKHLVISTIRGYVTAINHVFKATRDLNIGKNDQLIGLISNFERDTSIVRDPLPVWDLSVVLAVLRESPFEPMHLADMKFVTLKTVFLLTLATGSRRSEIHALKFEGIQWQDNGGSVLLFPSSQFLAKTELVNTDVIKPMHVKAVTRVLGNDDKDRVLCPVRALKFYLKRTEDVRDSRKKLFLAFKSGYKSEIARNTVSGWLKKVVLLAYELACKDTKSLYNVKAHQVRAMASSYAFHRNCSMEKILMACSWKHHTTFTQFYLRDLTFTDQEGMKKLGPLVVAKQLV